MIKSRIYISGDIKQVWNDLSWVDKLLPLWILSAIIFGIVLSVYVPSSRQAFNGAEVVGVSIPLAVGLIVMMIPPLCKVQWEKFFTFFKKGNFLNQILISLAINWVLCPFLMFGLSWLTLFDENEYRTGVIMIGLARCIAMVLVWNQISNGDETLCAILVLINSLLQIVLYAPYQIFFCYVITGDYNLSSKGAVGVNVSYQVVARSVAFFLGIPLGAGLLIRLLARFTLGIPKFESKILPFISPWALIGLLYTITVIFIEKGNDFIHEIGSAVRCFIPLIAYFFITWFGTFFFSRWFSSRTTSRKMVSSEESVLLCGCEKNSESNEKKWKKNCSADYKEVITQTFTASSNNFELSIAVAISLYGSGSKQAIAATFGPLLEVPILLFLCFVAKYFKIKFLWRDASFDASSLDEDVESLEDRETN